MNIYIRWASRHHFLFSNASDTLQPVTLLSTTMILSGSKTLLATALLAGITGALAAAVETKVKLPGGDTLSGSVCPTTSVKRFRGVPYAQPPTGNLRFMPPKELNGSLNQHGTPFDASHAAAPCPQFSTLFADTDPTPSEKW